MKRLLVLSYYYPPLGQSGVQRVLKLVKYLPRHGWQPVVVTPRAVRSDTDDPALLAETAAPVYRTASLDPRYLSARRRGAAPAMGRGPLSAVNRWLVPDNKLGWVPFAVGAGRRAAREHRIDAILSSAPPYSSHLAGLALKRATGVPLLCDFRDAWTRFTWGRYPTPLHRACDRWLESRCVRGSDLVLGVNQAIVDELRGGHPDLPAMRFALLSHGYDPEDFSDGVAPDQGRFTIVHAGTFINNRGPAVLLAALQRIRTTAPEACAVIRVVFAGAARAVDRRMVRDAGLSATVSFTGYLPHADSTRMLQRASALWLVMGPEETANVTPGKLFEYLGAGRPILASVPLGGEAARIVRETGAGEALPAGDAGALAGAIAGMVRRWRSGKALYHAAATTVGQYDRRRIARQLAGFLDSLDQRRRTQRKGDGR